MCPNINFKKKIANNHNILTNKLVTIFTLTNNKNKTFPNMFQIFLKKKKKKANNHNIVKTLPESVVWDECYEMSVLWVQVREFRKVVSKSRAEFLKRI